MTRHEIHATLKAMQIIMHLQGHLHELAEKESGKSKELLKCADDSLSIAVQAMNSTVVFELMDGGGQA